MLALFYFPSKFPNTNKAHNINVFLFSGITTKTKNSRYKSF